MPVAYPKTAKTKPPSAEEMKKALTPWQELKKIFTDSVAQSAKDRKEFFSKKKKAPQ